MLCAAKGMGFSGKPTGMLLYVQELCMMSWAPLDRMLQPSQFISEGMNAPQDLASCMRLRSFATLCILCVVGLRRSTGPGAVCSGSS